MKMGGKFRPFCTHILSSPIGLAGVNSHFAFIVILSPNSVSDAFQFYCLPLDAAVIITDYILRVSVTNYCNPCLHLARLSSVLYQSR